MRLIMAVSADGFLCKDSSDDMKWTGNKDKKLFRILTSVGGICAAGKTTYNIMPNNLQGRQLICLSRNVFSLEELQYKYKDVWLLGGPTIAQEAMSKRYISEFHIVTILGEYLLQGVDFTKTFPHTPPPAMVSYFGTGTNRVKLEVLRFV